MSCHPNTSHPTRSPSRPGNTYEFCFSRCRTFLCSSWFWAVHADILGQGEGVSSGDSRGSVCHHAQSEGWALYLLSSPSMYSFFFLRLS